MQGLLAKTQTTRTHALSAGVRDERLAGCFRRDTSAHRRSHCVSGWSCWASMPRRTSPRVARL